MLGLADMVAEKSTELQKSVTFVSKFIGHFDRLIIYEVSWESTDIPICVYTYNYYLIIF